jgi:hypothetical protein
MPKRHDDELSASPDWTLIFEDRIWIIELKTERGSYRANQLPHYLDMAFHHYPGRVIDVTYLTGPLTKPAPRLRERQRYVHLSWDAVLPLYARAWGDMPDPRIRRYLEVLEQALGALSTPWNDWRTQFADTTPAPTTLDPMLCSSWTPQRPTTSNEPSSTPPRAHRTSTTYGSRSAGFSAPSQRVHPGGTSSPGCGRRSRSVSR